MKLSEISMGGVHLLDEAKIDDQLEQAMKLKGEIEDMMYDCPEDDIRQLTTLKNRYSKMLL